jgi:hypothetical protein
MRHQADSLVRRWVDLTIVLLMLVVIGIVWHGLEVVSSDTFAQRAHVVTQFITSNWPSGNDSLDRKSWWFIILVLIKFVFAWGPIAGIGAIFAGLIKEKRLHMRYLDLLALRERTIKDRFLATIKASDEEKKEYSDLLEGFAREADEELRVQLSGLFGEDEATRIMARKEQTEHATL